MTTPELAIISSAVKAAFVSDPKKQNDLKITDEKHVAKQTGKHTNTPCNCHSRRQDMKLMSVSYIKDHNITAKNRDNDSAS